jgi:hypothetical protein
LAKHGQQEEEEGRKRAFVCKRIERDEPDKVITINLGFCGFNRSVCIASFVLLDGHRVFFDMPVADYRDEAERRFLHDV